MLKTPLQKHLDLHPSCNLDTSKLIDMATKPPDVISPPIQLFVVHILMESTMAIPHIYLFELLRLMLYTPSKVVKWVSLPSLYGSL
jgi:hypothetical protein